MIIYIHIYRSSCCRKFLSVCIVGGGRGGVGGGGGGGVQGHEHKGGEG